MKRPPKKNTVVPLNAWGFMYEHGDGVAPDLKKSANWYAEGANLEARMPKSRRTMGFALDYKRVVKTLHKRDTNL